MKITQVSTETNWECCNCGWTGKHSESCDKTPIIGNLNLLVCPKCKNKSNFYKK